jgi:hypothetical protein
MKLAVLDDYLDIARSAADWSVVDGRAEITVFTQPIALEDAPLVLADFDAVCLLRERMPPPCLS